MIVVPLGMAFQFVLYERLKALQGTIPEKKSNTAFIIVMVIVGVLVALAVIGIFAAVILASLGVAREKGADFKRESDVKMISLGLELYADGSSPNEYPASLDQLVPQDLPTLPTDPTTHAPYDYQVSADAQSYQVCATLKDASTTIPAAELTDGTTFVNGHYCMSGSLSSMPATSTDSVHANSATLNPGP